MLLYAEECHSEKVGAALVSLAQTLKDAGRDLEALPYARRELQLCSDPREACRSALYLADLMISAGSEESEIRENFNLALSHSKESKDKKLEVSVLRELLDYLENIADVEEAKGVKSRLNELEEVLEVESDEEEDPKSQNIGEDICLEDLSDVEDALNKSEGIQRPKRSFKRGFVVKKNPLGETQLHVACINGSIENVEKLLAEGHPVQVRDNCGWTPLHEAANHGFVDIARELIQAGADVNDPGGSMCGAVTPLHDAAACGHFSMIYFLLESGANVNAVTDSGETVLDSLESWKNRVEGDSSNDEVEYDFAHEKLRKLTTVSSKTRKKSVPQRPRWNGLLDEDEDKGEDRRKESKKPEKISAGEDYKRTIENLKHRGGLVGTKVKNSKVQRVTAPLIDSEQILVDDWLEEDVVLPTTKKRTSCETPLNVKRNSTESTSSVKRNPSTDSSVTIKRKSSNGFLELENESKRQRKLSTESEGSVDFDTNSRDSVESNDSMFSEFPRKVQKKRTRQLSLLKTGFTKDANSRTPSPIFPPTSNHSPKQIASCEVLNFSVLVDYDTYDAKITYISDRQNLIESLMEQVKNKFEKDTACKAKLRFTTWEGLELSPETTPCFLKRLGDPIKLKGEIIDMYTPSIIDRYKAISKDYKISKLRKIFYLFSLFKVATQD